MTEHTPTTEDILGVAQYGAVSVVLEEGRILDEDEFRGMFDRWLNEIRAEAWDEGYSECNSHEGYFYSDENPYRHA